jgi:hypothetical protein
LRTELAFTYDAQMHPLSARCTRCGGEMPRPGPEVDDREDIIFWFSARYVEHIKLKHSATAGP